MEKKQAQNLSGLVSVKGDAKPLENIPVRTSEAPVIKDVAESINDTPLNFKVSAEFRKRFKAFAVDNDLKQYELLIVAFEEYAKKWDTKFRIDRAKKITNKIKEINTESLYHTRDGIKVYVKTYKSLLSEISNKHIDEKREINEFVKQHISEEYKGIISISEFRQIKEEENLVKNQFFDSEIVYFSKKEFSTLKYLEQNFNSERIKEYAILGNPGNGKTTFANFIKNKIKRKIFFIDLSSPQINYKNLKEDLIQISHFHSFIIVDNIHDNIDLFNSVLNKKIRRN